MNKLIKLAGIAIFAAVFAIDANAATAATGSCYSKAAKLSIGASPSGTLVEEYDEEFGDFTGNPVFYCKLTVKRGDSVTIVMSGDSTYFSVEEGDIYEGESETSPPWWEDASSAYVTETRMILRADAWDEDAPDTVTYYVVVSGEEIGNSFTLQTMSGEVDAPVYQGVDVDTAVTIKPNTTLATVKKTLDSKYNGGYYFKATLTAGLKYYFGTYDETAYETDVFIDDFNSGVVPTMTPLADTDKIDGTQIAGGTHAGYCVIPSNTATYVIFVSNTNNTSITLHHKVEPSRKPSEHSFKDLGTPGTEVASADISPAYRNNPASGVFDGTIDDALVSAKLEKGKKYLFYVDGLSSDPGNLLMELYDANGTVLLSSRKGFFGESVVGPMFVYEATAAGTYYVGVCQDTADSVGNESPTAGLTGRISVSTVEEDPFLDEYDKSTDPNAEVTPITPAIGEYGEAPETVDSEGQVHSFGLTDWTDTFTLPVRKGITYSFSVTPETGTFTNGEEEVEVSGAGFAYVGTLYMLSGKTKSVVKKVTDLSATNLFYEARGNTTLYLEVTKDGQGVPAAYSLHSMASAPNGIGYLTVNIHGPTAAQGAAWYLKGDSSALNYPSGTTVLLPVNAVTVKCLPVKGFSTPKEVSGTVKKGETTTLDAYYDDTSDPLDDDPDTTKKEPTTNKKYAPTKLTPSAKGVTALRSLWKVDPADWFTFTASSAGTYYKFLLSNTEGDPEVRVYGPNNWTKECDYVLATNAAEAVQICAEKGTYYVKVAHADSAEPEDSAYTLTAVSAVPGVVKIAKTAISVKDSAGYADVSVSRTGKDGTMRVKFRTEGVQSDKDDAYYYPTNGIVEWAANDNKAKTIRVKLVPYAGWGTNKTVKVVFEPISVDDESFDMQTEYVASFEKDKKTGLPLDTATITIAASAKKVPGTVQVAGCEPPKKPVLSVKAGEAINIPFVRVLGTDGVIGVKVETVKGTANKSGDTDFDPVTTNLVWDGGETLTQQVSVVTKAIVGDYTAVKTFTLKLSALTSKNGDPVQYDKPVLASSTVTINVVNEKFTEAFDGYAKTITDAANGYTVKEGKKGTWVVMDDGSFFAPNKGDITFTFKTTGTFTYTVDGESRTFTATAKDKTLKISGASTFSIDGYALDGEQVALYQGVKYAASFGKEGTVKAANLPAGLKLAQDKATKEWMVAGTPSKAGIYQTTYTTTIDKSTPVVVSNICYAVAAEGTAAGTFNGLVTTSDTTNGVPTLASITITAALGGKLSASVSIAGKKYAFADTGYASVAYDLSDPDAPVANMTAELSLVQKIGSGKDATTVTNWLYYTVTDVPETDPSGWLAEGTVDILMAMLPDAKGKGYQEDVSYTGKVYRDNSKSGKDGKAAWEAAMAAHSGYYTVSLAATAAMLGEPCGNGYMTMTLDAKGKAKLAGKLADGTAYSGSTAAALVGDADAPSVRVPLFAQKASWVFGGWLSIKADDNGFPVATVEPPDTDIVWKNDDPASTREGEDGFELELQAVGGWYDTVSNLQRSYLESDLAVDLPDGDAALDEIMEALALGDGYAFVAQPSGEAVDLVGNTLSVAKQSLVKDVADKKLNDFAASVNASNVKLTFKRATGIVSGTFDLWYEGVNSKGASEQKAVTGLKHEGVLVLSRGDDGFIEDEVLSSGFFLAPQNIKYIDAKGKEQKRKWTGSYRFDIRATPVSRTWTDYTGE